MAYHLKIISITGIVFMLCSTVIFAFQNKSPTNLEHIEIAVGQTTTIKTLPSSELYISRKVILTAQYLDHGDWRLIGLKVGTSLIQSENKSWLVHVIKRPQTPLFTKQIPSWICNKGLECSEGDFIISGSALDPFLFLKAKSWCLQQKLCFFSASLDQAAIARLHKFYQQNLGKDFEVFISSGGVSEFIIPCEPGSKTPNKTDINKLKVMLKIGYQDIQYLVSCRRRNINNYKLSSRVVLVSKSAVDLKDFDTNHYLSISKKSMEKTGSLSKVIQMLLSQKKATVIGEPQLFLQEGQKAQIQSGGEFPVLAKTVNDTLGQAWKKYGLSLMATLTLQDHKAILDINFSLSTRGSASSNNLATSLIKTEVALEPGMEVLIGSVEIKTQQTSSQENSLMGGIPLIGPLFKAKTEEDSYSKLLLFVQINEP
ncbi:MAG: hypothetical protein HRU09_10130 [Oligoflexales bacterium]|nr:hypothetical protein [Oligoflexales bacterium]